MKAALTFALSVVLMIPHASSSEPLVGQKFGDWTFECTALSQNQVDCGLVQVIVANEGRDRIARLRISAPSEDGSGVLSVLIPLGTNLRDGLEATLSDDTPIPLVPLTCTNRGCVLTSPLSKDLAEQLSMQSRLVLSFSVVNTARRVKIESPLDGLAEAFEQNGWY